MVPKTSLGSSLILILLFGMSRSSCNDLIEESWVIPATCASSKVWTSDTFGNSFSFKRLLEIWLYRTDTVQEANVCNNIWTIKTEKKRHSAGIASSLRCLFAKEVKINCYINSTFYYSSCRYISLLVLIEYFFNFFLKPGIGYYKTLLPYVWTIFSC